MKTSYKVILSLTALVAAIIAAKGPPQWPSVLGRCTINDPQFDKCLKKITGQALQRMAKGMPMVGIRPLDPLRDVSFRIVTARGPITLSATANNVTITGPSKVQLKKLAFDRRTSTYWFEGMHNHLKMVGNYRVNGNVFVFPINSSGTFEYEARGGYANHTLKFKSNTKDPGHGDVGFTLKSVKGQKINLKDTTLGAEGTNLVPIEFGRMMLVDPERNPNFIGVDGLSYTEGNALNNLVNENWDEISRVLWDPMERVVQDLYTAALKPLMKKFAMKDFFPPTLAVRSAEEVPVKDEEPVSYSYSIQY